ncbi:Epoxide hydrolase 1 (Epoxide hydratase) (Microsomal epoxide hydrolase) (mEH), partial [Durusdinium trenchii]
MRAVLWLSAVAAGLGVAGKVYYDQVFLSGCDVADWDACWALDEAACGIVGQPEPMPFAVPQQELDDLQNRLRTRRPLKGLAALHNGSDSSWMMGIDIAHLEKALDFWENDYDWRAVEEELNALNPHMVLVQGLHVHYLHIKPQDTSKPSIPMLMMHGWPGSIYEFHKAAPLLAAKNPRLELIIPSLPGYGFSEGSHKPGLDACAMGVLMHVLMSQALGFEKYFVQGGDWGSIIAHCMLQKVPEGTILGTHVNMALVMFPFWSPIYGTFVSTEASEKERANFFSLPGKLVQTIPYMGMQATKPHTVGFALNDSPVATAAWILDKFESWTDPSSELTMNELITNLMFYYVPGANGSAMRLYHETMYTDRTGHVLKCAILKPVTAPMGLSDFPFEILPPARFMIPSRYRNLKTHHIAQKGGHFAAFEQPETLAQHVHEFLQQRSARLDKRAVVAVVAAVVVLVVVQQGDLAIPDEIMGNTHGLIFCKNALVGKKPEGSSHGIFMRKTKLGWSFPLAIHFLGGTLTATHSYGGELDLLILINDEKACHVLETVGQIGFGSSQGTELPRIRTGIAPRKDKEVDLYREGLQEMPEFVCNSSFAYQLKDGRVYEARARDVTFGFRESSNDKFYHSRNANVGNIMLLHHPSSLHDEDNKGLAELVKNLTPERKALVENTHAILRRLFKENLASENLLASIETGKDKAAAAE